MRQWRCENVQRAQEEAWCVWESRVVMVYLSAALGKEELLVFRRNPVTTAYSWLETGYARAFWALSGIRTWRGADGERSSVWITPQGSVSPWYLSTYWKINSRWITCVLTTIHYPLDLHDLSSAASPLFSIWFICVQELRAWRRWCTVW